MNKHLHEQIALFEITKFVKTYVLKFFFQKPVILFLPSQVNNNRNGHDLHGYEPNRDTHTQKKIDKKVNKKRSPFLDSLPTVTDN